MKMPSSFFSRSARCGPTPFKYSIGLDNMCEEEEMMYLFLTKIAIASCQLVKTITDTL